MEYHCSMKMKTSHKNGILLLIILAVFTGTFAYRSVIDVDIMEARNFVAAREMAAGGSLLVPTMNGDLRLAKPPLPTWLTAAGVAYAGTDNAMSIVRVPAALAGLLMLAGIYVFARFFSGSKDVGYYTVLTLSTSFLFMLMARKNTWDIYAHAFMAAGLAAIVYAHAEKVKNALSYYAFGGLMFAASSMSKGPVSFYTVLLPLLTAACFTFSPMVFIRRYYGRILLCVAVTTVFSSLWPLYVYMHETHAVLSTVSAESTAWVSRHMKPFWYYVQFPAMLGLWCVMLVPLLYPKFAFKRIDPVRAKFYLIWLFSALVLLSVIPEKKDRYLLPVVIPSAFLVGEYLAGLARCIRPAKADRYIVNIWAFLGIFLLFGAVTGTVYLQITKKYVPWAHFAVFWSVSAVFLYFSVQKIRKEGAVRGIPYVITCLCLTFLLAAPFIKMSGQDFRTLEKVRNDAAFSQYKTFYGDLGIKEVWAIGRKVRPLSELPADSADAVFVTSSQDEVPAGFAGNRIAVYSSRDGRSWSFYRLGRRDGELKELIIARSAAVHEDEQ